MLDLPEEKIVGYLHDTVEDTEVTIPEIREIFGDRVADAVALMTHADGVPYMDYVKEIGKNPLARKVKMADLTHNMDLTRIKNPGQKDYDRIERKYKPAYAYLKGLRWVWCCKAKRLLRRQSVRRGAKKGACCSGRQAR